VTSPIFSILQAVNDPLSQFGQGQVLCELLVKRRPPLPQVWQSLSQTLNHI